MKASVVVAVAAAVVVVVAVAVVVVVAAAILKLNERGEIESNVLY